MTPNSIWSGRLRSVTVANLTIVALAAFDNLAVVAALPTIAEDLGDVGMLPWVATGYLAASSVAIIVAGPIIDAVGVRRTFRLTGLWFLLASGLCAAAPTLPLLVAARVLQGIGGGMVIAVALASVGIAYPGRLRPRAFAANSLVWGLLGFGGPAVAAGLLALSGWRLIFVVQLPLTALALAAGWRTLPSTRRRPTRPEMDLGGIGMLTALTVIALVGFAQIGQRWGVVAVAAGASVALVAAYWRHSGRHDDAVLARRHLVGSPYRFIHVAASMVMAAGLAVDNYLPLYVQVSRGRSAEFAAFTVVFLTMGWSIAAVVASRLLDRHTEPQVMMGGACLLVPGLLISGLGVVTDGPLSVVFVGFFIVGFGIGSVSTPGLTLLQADTDEHEMGRVNAAHQFIRGLGFTYGVAVGGAVLLSVVDLQLGDVEVVRAVLRGEDVAVGADAAAAVRDGLAWVHVVALGLALTAVAAAVNLLRGVPRPVLSRVGESEER